MKLALKCWRHGLSMSPPARGRGLKLDVPGLRAQRAPVAPRAGAWIETIMNSNDAYREYVAPRAGAWIETDLTMLRLAVAFVAPRAGAWIETTS